MSFSKLGLSDPILKAVSELGYKTPTDIQKRPFRSSYRAET
jgi:superfamily II DNA/RNA helicase